MAKKHTIITTREALLDALSIPARITPLKSPVEAYLRVTLSCENDEVRVFASDGTVSADVHMAATASGPFKVCVAGRELADVVKRCGAPDVEIDIHGEQHLVVRSGGNSWKLPVTNADHAPLPVDVGNGRFVATSISADLLVWMLASTLPSASQDASRAHLNGVLLQQEDAIYRAVSTDGHRLTLVEADAPEGERGKSAQVLLPRAAAGLLAATMLGRGELVVRYGARALVVEAGPVTVSAICFDDQFPPYMKVIPRRPPHLIDIDPRACTAEVSRVAMERAGLLRFDFDSESWVMGWADKDGRASMGRIEIEGGPGEPLVSGANSAYMLEGLAVAAPAAAKTVLGLTGPIDPIKLTTDGGGRRTTVVIMPVRV